MTATPGDFAAVIAAIDRANAADPTQEEGRPAALLYGERMSAELVRMHPDASEALRIAARGQHVERWHLRRDAYPEGRDGYLEWRREQARRHAARLAGMMEEAGYEAAMQERVGTLLRKEGLKRNPEVQALEDVICFVFVRHYLEGFAEKHAPEEIDRIVRKTARKMSAGARDEALATFPMPHSLAEAFQHP